MRMRIQRGRIVRRLTMAAVVLAGAAAATLHLHAQASSSSAPARSASMPQRPALIPWPTSAEVSATDSMPITTDTVIEIAPSQPDLRRIAEYLAALVEPALETHLAIRE